MPYAVFASAAMLRCCLAFRILHHAITIVVTPLIRRGCFRAFDA